MTAAGTLEHGPSIGAVRRRVGLDFRRAGLEAPDLDARLLVGHALRFDHAALVAQEQRRISSAETQAIALLAARRLAREPVARIIGQKEFWGLPFMLNADTLVPRPETETIVEAALDFPGRARAEPLRIADLGTGSGALLLALLSELPAAYGIGTDSSVRALGCARGNAAALGLARRAAFVTCDYAAALHGPFDLIVCNPPYIPRAEIAGLAPEVRCFDPLKALDGGPEGLDGFRAIAAHTPRLLAPDGRLIVELGTGQGDAVVSLFAGAGLVPTGPPRRDLAGVARALIVKALS
ncbi:MAG TPA: peptide chain release factor N(5)-glutamine methyltransferase [Sphingomonas sp.]|nr:peptide chain release factor N(5)-glutamine methyltransferase [Sphingomonas sp.]